MGINTRSVSMRTLVRILITYLKSRHGHKVPVAPELGNRKRQAHPGSSLTVQTIQKALFKFCERPWLKATGEE